MVKYNRLDISGPRWMQGIIWIKETLVQSYEESSAQTTMALYLDFDFTEMTHKKEDEERNVKALLPFNRISMFVFSFWVARM